MQGRGLETVELFAGAGGMALGLKRAGFRPRLLADFDAGSCATLRANAARLGVTPANVRCVDVRELDYSGFAEVDLLSAGAPCQPFSQGGRLRGEDDDRNMFPEAVRAIREIRPRAFILENVRGLLFPRVRPYFDFLLAELRMPSRSLRNTADWEAHRETLDAIPHDEHEYAVHWKIFNAADFGLGQARPRLVIVGLRKDEADWAWPEPTHSRAALIRELQAERYWDAHEVPDRIRRRVRRRLSPSRGTTGYGQGHRWRTLRDVMRQLGPPARSARLTRDPFHTYVGGARLYAKHTGSALDWPAKTVKAGVNGSPGGEHIVVQDSGYFRYLTVRECARLQGFPKRYELPELRGKAMRQLGNAVPVPLAAAMGRRIAVVLNGED
jgi:DNA (cytosine-5)-methyltransferase 1